jgi:hypothetical protein
MPKKKIQEIDYDEMKEEVELSGQGTQFDVYLERERPEEQSEEAPKKEEYRVIIVTPQTVFAEHNGTNTWFPRVHYPKARVGDIIEL